MISIHALLAESDGVCNQKPPQARKFLSTLSLRRATGIITTFAIIAGHFYPRSPCGERPSPCVVMNVRRDFYPRSPCGERRCQRGPGVPDLDFYPRSPCGERLQRQIEFERYSDISIHALLAESDAYCINDVRCIVISIHALLAESDRQALHIIHAARNFYPRSPCGERPARCRIIYNAAYFYPRSPCGERHCKICIYDEFIPISIHALLAESDSAKMRRSESPR